MYIFQIFTYRKIPVQNHEAIFVTHSTYSVCTPLNIFTAPLWHFWWIILPCFLTKKFGKIIRQKTSKSSCWKFLLNTWSVRIRVHKIRLKRFRSTQFSAILEQQIIVKWVKIGFHSKHCHILIHNRLYSKPDYQVMPCSQKTESWL